MTNQFNPHEVVRDMRAALPPPPPLSSNCQKITEGTQQRWNRAIPEADYIQLGTLRYGVRLSNPNLLNLSTPPDATTHDAAPVNGSNGVKQHLQTPTGSNVGVGGGRDASSSSNSGSSAGPNKSCCCIGSGGEIEMPWNSSYARTRLPVPNSLSKNRKSSPSTSASSSSSSSAHQRLHQAQISIDLQQGTRGKLQYNNGLPASVPPANKRTNNNSTSSTASVDKQNTNRETSPASTTTVCCYSNNFGSAFNKNAKNNNLVKVSNKYSDSKRLKIVNNKGEHKSTTAQEDNDRRSTGSANRNGNSRNLNEKWSNSFEYGAAINAQEQRNFSPLVSSSRKDAHSGSVDGVAKQNDGDDLNLNFRDAQQSKEPRVKDVNINNFKRKNISSDVYFGPNSSVGRTRNNNEKNIRNNTTTSGVAGDVCTDELSSSPSVSPRSPSPLPLPPPSVVEPWLFDECVRSIPPIPLASPHLSALSQNNTQRDSNLPSTDFPPKNFLQRPFSDPESTVVYYDIAETLVDRNGNPEKRKCSLPVQYSRTTVDKSQLQRKFSADNSRLKSNSSADSAVICHFTPKPQSTDRSDAETRLQSLSRYCAKNLDLKPDVAIVKEAALEDFIFIDSSDISTTSEDIITVINEEDYHDFHKFTSVPKIECALVENLCQSVCDSRRNPNSCSSDELSSVCSGSESAPTLAATGFGDDAKRNFNTIKYKQREVVKIPSCYDGNQTNRSATPTNSEQQYVTASDSNNNRRTRSVGEELKYNSSNNSPGNNEVSGGETKTISNNRNSTQLKFNNLSPDNSSSSLNCFGKSQLYAKSSTEKLIMEKRSNTLDRLQKLVKKTTSGSGEGKSSDKHASTKTERLRELTELLKGTRAPPVPPPRRPKHLQSVDKSFERPNAASSTKSLLNIDALHNEDSCSNLLKSKESRSIDIPYQFADSKRASTPNSPSCEHKTGLRANVSTSNLECLQGSTSAKDTAVDETKSEASFKGEDEIFVKLSRPESRTIVGSYTQKTIPFRSASFSQVDYSSGKYIRSALGAIKNSLMRNKESSAIDNVTLPRNKKDCRSCSPAQFSTTSEPGCSTDDIEASKVSLKKTEISINLAPPDSYERCEGLEGKEISSNRNSDIETIVEDPEAEHIENVENELVNQKRAAINVVQASEMVLEPLVEEGVPIIPQTLTKDEECLQQATTCLIPVPVFDCVVSEWSAARPSEQWIDASMTECNKLTDCLDSITEANEKVVAEEEASTETKDTLVIENPPEIMEPEILKLECVNEAEEEFVEPPKGSSADLTDTFDENIVCSPPVSIICTEPDSMVSTTIIETPPTPDESVLKHETPDVEIVEVRKRHSNNEESGETLSSGNSEVEEKRRIDKSKRRKGIYIQWPAIDTNIDPESDSNDNCQPEDSWRPNKLTIKQDSSVDLSGESFTDLSSKEITSSPEKSKECDILSRGDPFMLEPNTPDSDITKPFWPKGHRRQSLTYQSSDEKDDSAVLSAIPVRSFKNIFLRSDSVSDNESERASSRDRASASPAPSGELDLKRYSKRPLRGPYGQMLEAEMKKPSKVHYNEILEELSRHESSHSFPSFNRGRGSGSQSMDETNDRHSSKLFKPRKASTNLPLPSHSRTASSPSKLAELGIPDSSPQMSPSKRHLGQLEQRSTDSDKSEKSTNKLESKKFSLDSHLTDSHDKHAKRNSSSASDKHPKRSLDDTRLAQPSRTPSERSFVLNSPETPKGLVASPELLAELLKGSSEKLVTEQLTSAASPNNGSNALPTAVLKCLDTRTHVVVELFNTEKSYVESLQTIVLKYLNQLKSSENAGLVDTQTVDEIFFMVPAILNIHERFLEELRRRLDAWDPLQKIGDAFVDVFSRPVILDTYTSFVNNWNRAKDAIRTTRQKCPAFARFLEAMAREHKGKLSLDNLLIKPVQKFPNYELILSRLIKHTDIDHPDQKPLQEALKLVHDILMFLNCKEKEALENGQRETALRELEGVIEGMNDLVTPERAFLLFDLVSMPSGQTRKERGFFLFNDLLVITSIKRRSGTIRKTNMTCPGSVASTLDTNKYKFLTKISLDDLEIVKSKDENIRRIMKEIEHLSDDSNKLSQISELAASLRCPHQLLEEAIRDLQREVQRQLSERQTNDTQLNILELTLTTSNGIQNMTVVFSKPDKRSQWEETFAEAKQKLASAIERSHVPDFLVSVPIRKTRAGLQFTCASPTLGVQRDVWVCNSDGYVGQVCVLSLVPEPTVTSCNGVCNARILCVASVPASDYGHHTGINISVQDPSASLTSTINSIVNSTSKSREKRSSKTAEEANKNSARNSTNIQLDSGSSSEDSETESQPERTASPSHMVASSTMASSPAVAGHRHQESNSEETDVQQSTMWLGTEDGCIHVYNCTDNIRIKKNKIKISHISAVYSILYLSNKVFVSLANGDVCVYSRDHNGWNTANPTTISVGTVSSPVTKLLNVHDKLWCAIQGCIKILNTTTLQIDSQIQISNDSKPITNMSIMNDYVWISVQNSAHLKCCHYESFEIIFEVNLAPSVNKMLSNCDDIIRQHKAACLRVTSLLSCKDLIWVGTSAGVLLTIAASTVSKGSSLPAVTGIPHGHTGHVRFLTFVESPTSASMDDLSKVGSNNTNKSEVAAMPAAGNNPSPNLLVISGGDGYEDFRSSGSNTVSEIAGREDSTNHLLLWQV